MFIFCSVNNMKKMLLGFSTGTAEMRRSVLCWQTRVRLSCQTGFQLHHRTGRDGFEAVRGALLHHVGLWGDPSGRLGLFALPFSQYPLSLLRLGMFLPRSGGSGTGSQGTLRQVSICTADGPRTGGHFVAGYLQWGIKHVTPRFCWVYICNNEILYYRREGRECSDGWWFTVCSVLITVETVNQKRRWFGAFFPPKDRLRFTQVCWEGSSHIGERQLWWPVKNTSSRFHSSWSNHCLLRVNSHRN